MHNQYAAIEAERARPRGKVQALVSARGRVQHWSRRIDLHARKSGTNR